MKHKISVIITAMATAALVFAGCDKENMDGSESQVRIYEVVPDYAYKGDEVILYGRNIPDDASVSINGIAAEIVSCDSEKIRFIVPDTDTGVLELEAGGDKVSYKGFRIYKDVVIDSFFPEGVTYNGEITIRGSGFDGWNKTSNIVTIIQEDGETEPLEVLEASEDSIVVFVRDFFVGPNKICVRVGRNSGLSEKEIRFVSDARIDGITPRRGGAGTIVTITGMNFITEDASLNSVSIGGVSLEVVEVPDRTQMKVRIPEGLDRNDVVTVSVPGEESSAVSAEKFRYDAARDLDWGRKGISYGGKNMPTQVTQGMVDSLLAAGTGFITFRGDYTAEEGLATGVIPDTVKTVLDNAIKVHQMSGGQIKVVYVIGHSKNLGGTGYPLVSDASVSSFFENIKAYECNGSRAWDCIDAFQVLYSTGELNDIKSETGVKDYVDNVLKRVYLYIHPEGYCKTGEKLVFGPQVILNNANYTVRPEIITATGLMEWLDTYLIMWNLNNGSGKNYYSRPVPENVFYQHWNNFGRSAVNADPDFPVAFMTPEVNINAANACYQNIEELGAAIQYIVNEMAKEPTYIGFGYRAFLENNVGIRRADNNLDPRTDDNTAEPQISIYDMYSNLKLL